METRRLGKTEHEGPVVVFAGIAAGRLEKSEAVEALNRCLDKGIIHIDVAPSYGDSEVKIGEVMKHRRKGVFLAAKTLERSKEGAAKELRQSLRNLQTDWLDLYQLHAVDTDEDLERVLAPDGAIAAIQEAQQEGLVRFIGITGHRPDIQARALKLFDFDTVLTPVNFIDRFIMNTEGGLLPLAEKMDVGVISMKATYRGAIQDVETAYRYTLSQKVARTVPTGDIGEVEQAIDLAASPRPMSVEEMEMLFRDAPDLGNLYCRQCGYCLPCPVGIDIPRIFAMEGYYSRYRKDIAVKQFAIQPIKPGACTACGLCDERCPFGLKVMKRMKGMEDKLAGKMEPGV